MSAPNRRQLLMWTPSELWDNDLCYPDCCYVAILFGYPPRHDLSRRVSFDAGAQPAKTHSHLRATMIRLSMRAIRMCAAVTVTVAHFAVPAIMNAQATRDR